MPRLCACGCGQPVTGRRSRRFYSDACRVKAHRRGAPRVNSKVATVAENPLQGVGAVSQDTSVPETYLGTREVFCPGCGSPMPRLRGPLPVPAYCRECSPGG